MFKSLEAIRLRSRVARPGSRRDEVIDNAHRQTPRARAGFTSFRRVFLALAISAAAARADVRLPHLVSDGMVLQRERRVGIFGFAEPGERVQVTASWGASADEAVTDGNGRWTTALITPAAGGPFTVTVRGKNTLEIRDVLIGEVWLGSGQSNMEMPLAYQSQGYSGVRDWQQEVASANHARIRLFTVENTLAAAPQDDCNGRWSACTPESAAKFSATAYFFGRELEGELDVPIGLIASDWGGTPAESWVSGLGLRAFPEFTGRVGELARASANPSGTARERNDALRAWRDRLDEVDGGLHSGFARTEFDDASWETINVPGAWSGALASHDGVAWMRKELVIAPEMAGKPLVLELGRIDDEDVTWFDGNVVGDTMVPGAWSTPRAYRIDAALAMPGRHVIGVRVLDTGGAGGLIGKPEQIRLRAEDDSASISLAGPWRWKIGVKLASVPKLVLPATLDPWTPSALYNGMIAPLTQYGIRGVIWYQGESNRERAFQYKTLFPALIQDWRARFRQGDFPLFYVQIAPFAYSNDRGETGELREAQRLALAVPNTGMVVTMDIGDERDIHPKNKQEVGRRLALCALAKTYGKQVESSGPLNQQPASPIRDPNEPWITAHAAKGDPVRWTRSGDLLSLAAPIESWDEGVPLGNGLLGALIYGSGTTLQISLDRGDVWDLRRPDVTQRADWTWRTLQNLVAARDDKRIRELFDTPYDANAFPTKLPVGRIEIELDSASTLSTFGLEVDRGEARIQMNGGSARAFVCADEPVMMLMFEGLATVHPKIVAPRVDAYPLRVVGRAEEEAVQQVVLEAPASLSYAITLERRERGGAAIFAIAVTTNAESSDPSALGRTLVRSALDVGFPQRESVSVTWAKSFETTSHVTIPDPALQNHYDFVKYLHGAGSRHGAPPMPLQGVWTRPDGLPPWKGDYHNDLNTQMTYVAYPTAGLFDSGASFLEFHWKLLPREREFARAFYGVPGAVVPGVMALDGAPLGGWAQYSLSPTNGAWIAEVFARHARVSGDDEFLRDRAYPWSAEIGTALAALLVPDAAGKLKLPLSSSPEIHDASLAAWLAPNSNYDLALLRSLFVNLASMARKIGRSEDATRWTNALSRLDPFDVDPRTGALTFARGEPYAESHRHFSHALAIHPLGLLSIEGSPPEKRIVDATLDTILEQGTSAWCGYSFAWFSCMLARCGRPESALAFLKDYERAFTLKNGFHCNGDQSGEGLSGLTYRPFTLEGNMLAMEAVHEMLLQSWGGVVRVFPAVSRTWRDASFTDLWAEGGFRVSATRKDGRTTQISVTASHSGDLRLRDPFGAAQPFWSRDVTRDGQDWIVRLPAREELRGSIEPLAPPPAKRTAPGRR